MQKITIRTSKRDEVVDITDQVQKVLEDSGKKDGSCHIFVAHTTCALSTADLDPGTDQDYLAAFREMIPKINFKHPHDPAHMPDHILSSIVGTSISVPFENKKLLLGTWQRVVLFEFSGPRERELIIDCRS